jgi:hypothetical protein
VRAKSYCPQSRNLEHASGAMKRSKFTTKDGLVMLLGITLTLVLMLWLMLSGIVHVNH